MKTAVIRATTSKTFGRLHLNLRLLCCMLGLMLVSGASQAQNYPPPAGAILDLNGTPIPGGGTFQQYSVNFTATEANTAITFAIRDDPAYVSLSNVSVMDVTNPSGNLLVNGDFSGGTYSDNEDAAIPNGWTYTNTYGAEANGQVEGGCGIAGGYCWYDGAIGSYDAISQPIATNVGDSYQITFSVAENSECACDFSDITTNSASGIDVTVYAQAGVPLSGSTTTLTSSPNPSALGQSVSFTATVVGLGAGTITGTVNFTYGSTTLCSAVALSSGVATCAYSALPAGSDSVTANYSGNATFASSSGTVSQMVGMANTTTALTSSPNPSAVGQAVTFTATVSSQGSGTLTGTVNFVYGNTALCSAVALTSGVATCTSSALPAGSDVVTANYSGNADFSSSSGSVTQAVTQGIQYTTATALTSSSNPSTFNEQVTFTATVTAQNGGTPTGTVAFSNGAMALGASTLSGGTATFSTSALAVGLNSIAAVYGGSTNFVGSSGSLNQVVNQASTTVTLLSSDNPAMPNQAVTFTATITPQNGGQATGTVTFQDGTAKLGDGTVSANVASFTTSNLTNGTHSITASYGGDTNFTGNTSSPLQQIVGSESQGPYAYVADINGNSVSVINIPTSTVVNTIPVGSGPWGVAVSPDQSQVYVSNNHGNNVSVINTSTSTVVATIPVQSSPFGVAFTPDGTAAYVVNGSSNSVSVIDTASQTVTATLPVQSSPVGVAMAFTSSGTYAYVTNSGSNTVSVILAGSTPSVVATVPVGSGPRWVAVSPHSKWAYVENAGSNNVSVINVASNTVTATIPVGSSPFGAAFTPDSNFAYVANSGSNTVSVIATSSPGVIATVPGFSNPVQVAVTADGTSAYVTNLNANDVAVIATSSNTVTGTVAVGSAPIDVAIASAPPTQLQIMMPLSPTQPNVFNYGTYNQTVQYPPNTQFSDVNMTTTAVQIPQNQFQKRVAGTQFADAACIVYTNTGGNCVDFEVTCSDDNGNTITCPSEAQPTIAVQTSFTTAQGITNPGYLTTPIGTNEWTNIFTGYSDPTVKGKTNGFSEFVAVNLGASNSEGLAKFKLIYPKLPATYQHAHNIGMEIELTSAANRSPVTDAKVSTSITMIADGNGNPTQIVIPTSSIEVWYTTAPGVYKYNLLAKHFAAGTYSITIYGNAFPAYQGQFTFLH